MPRDFFPRPNGQAVAYTARFSSKLNADPLLYEVSPQYAADYAALQLAFAQLYHATSDPGMARPIDREARREARAALEAKTRSIAGCIRVAPGIPPEAKIAIGVKLKRPPRRISRPATAPIMIIRSVVGRTVTVDLCDAENTRRRRPAGVNGSMIYLHVGDDLPTGDQRWKLARQASPTRVQIAFPSDVAPGTKVWLYAQWMNPRHQPGPPGAPVYAHLGHGLGRLRDLARAA